MSVIESHHYAWHKTRYGLLLPLWHGLSVPVWVVDLWEPKELYISGDPDLLTGRGSFGPFTERHVLTCL